MSVHMISVLGTNLYEPVCYGNDVKGSHKEDSYIQTALVRDYRPDKVTVFLTDKAKEQNWVDREYDKKDEESSQRWKNSEHWVKCGQIKQGLKSNLISEFPDVILEHVMIPDGKNIDEIRDIFVAIYNCLELDEDVIFDVTHGFRSIPMIVISVLRYAKVMKNCRLKGIYYGAFDKGKDGWAPIFDLTIYDEIIEWSFAAEQFMNYGNALPMRDILKVSVLSDDSEKNNVKQIVDSMTDLSMAMITSRGSINGSGINREKNSIKQAYLKMKGMDLSVIRDSDNPALEKLIESARNKYAVLDKAKDYEIGMAVVKLCIDFKMINQGFTALEETIETFMCEEYKLDSQKERSREIVEIALGTRMAHNKRDNKQTDLWDFFTTKNERSKNYFKKLTEESEKETIKQMYLHMKKDYVEVSSRIKSFRNDINHFGIRKKPNGSEEFASELNDLYEKMLRAMEKSTK